MIGSLIGAGLSAAASIWGGLKASQAAKKAKAGVEAQRSENEAWYNRRYNEDATQRADAQRILAKTEEAIRDRNRAAAATSAVMGGTEESVAATKEANAQAIAEAASQIAMAGDRRKDTIEDQYRNTDSQLREQLNSIENKRANTIAQAVTGVSSAMGGLGSAWDEWRAGKNSGSSDSTSKEVAKSADPKEAEKEAKKQAYKNDDIYY